MKYNHPLHSKSLMKKEGFTLIEVMVVIALIGIIATMVQYTFSSKRPEDALKEVSFQFSGIFENAANYGLLNNIELGLYVKDNSYQFLGYDGVKWSEIPSQEWLSIQEMPEGIELILTLDDLPIDEPMLFDSSVLTEESNSYLSFDEIEAKKEEKVIPQVYILSGGDITPFSLTFQFTEEASLYDDLSEFAYRATGIYSARLKIEGPVLDE
jgi:general secretion pathway protein H